VASSLWSSPTATIWHIDAEAEAVHLIRSGQRSRRRAGHSVHLAPTCGLGHHPGSWRLTATRNDPFMSSLGSGLPHPGLDRSEGMLNRLAPLAHLFRMFVEPALPPSDRGDA